jgi:hypothetical protein
MLIRKPLKTLALYLVNIVNPCFADAKVLGGDICRTMALDSETIVGSAKLPPVGDEPKLHCMVRGRLAIPAACPGDMLLHGTCFPRGHAFGVDPRVSSATLR